MNDENTKVEIVFAPGCFDNFDGTQEELDEMIAAINQMVESGEIFEKARAIDLDNLSDEDQDLVDHLISIESEAIERKLQ